MFDLICVRHQMLCLCDEMLIENLKRIFLYASRYLTDGLGMEFIACW